MKQKSPSFAGLLVVAGLMQPSLAIAQELFVSPEQDVLSRLSSKPENISGEDVLGDHVNFQTGDLTFRQVDIDLPGHGPRIVISRTFAVGSRTAWNWRHDREFADWDLEIPQIYTNTTRGFDGDWKVIGSSPLARCTNFGPAANIGSFSANYWWQGVHLSIPGEGRQELMNRAPENTYVPTVAVDGVPRVFNIVTRERWAITCLPALKDGMSGEGFLAVSPDGTKYWFDKLVYRFEAYESEAQMTNLLRAPRLKASLLVTRVEDRYGNYVNYSYTNNLLTGITSSDGRSVQIVWSANRGNSLGAFYHIERIISLPGSPLQQTWQYTYLNRGTAQGTNVAPRWDLRTLVLPDQSSWTFSLGDLANNCYDNRDAPGCRWQTEPGISGSIKAPSGVVGTFRLRSSVAYRRGQYAVSPPATPWANSNLQLLEMDPITVSSPFLVEKKLSGPGIDLTWQYKYGGAVLQDGSLPSGKFQSLNPDGTLDVVYLDSAWGSPTEGQMVRREKYNGPVTVVSGQGYVAAGPALQVETFQYAAVPNKIGTVPRNNSNNLGEEFAWPIKTKTVSIDGVTLSSTVNAFDSFARPLNVTKTGSHGFSKTDTLEYYDDPATWVLDQLSRTTTNGVETSRTEYGWKALPSKIYSFGKLKQEFAYDSTSTVGSGQLGTLRTISDGNGKITTLSGWKLGIPQSLKFPVTPESPAGSSETRVVDNAGRITSITDENGYRTCYSHDAMGRLASITYPSATVAGVCDTSGGEITTQSFMPSTVARYGLPVGYWIHIADTGKGRSVKHYDALWRPVLEESFDNTNSASIAATHSLVAKRYDKAGRLEFQSYAVGNLTSFNDSALKGTTTFYDALGRATSVSKDSELAAPDNVLTTLTAYLSGFRTQVTNPKGQVTTTSYQAFDQPTYEFPVLILGPRGAVTEIERDVFGKPKGITRK